MSENLRSAKIPGYERVRKYRVHKIGVFSEKNTVSEHLRCPNIYGKYGKHDVVWLPGPLPFI